MEAQPKREAREAMMISLVRIFIIGARLGIAPASANGVRQGRKGEVWSRISLRLDEVRALHLYHS